MCGVSLFCTCWCSNITDWISFSIYWLCMACFCNTFCTHGVTVLTGLFQPACCFTTWCNLNNTHIIVKNQFEVSNAMSQLGTLANFIAYAFLGLPAGFILKRKGYKILEAPSRTEVRESFGCNFVALEPGLVLMPQGNPRCQELLENNGVKVITIDISEIMKGRGALHCITAFLKRG